MEIEIYITLNKENIENKIPYALICETIESSQWKTGARKRKFAQEFSENERERIYKMHKQAYSWYLVKGAPNEIKMELETFLLWQQLANFCLSL